MYYDMVTFLAWVLLSFCKLIKKRRDDACISLTVHIFADDIDNIVNDKSGFIGHKHTCFHDH